MTPEECINDIQETIEDLEIDDLSSDQENEVSMFKHTVGYHLSKLTGSVVELERNLEFSENNVDKLEFELQVLRDAFNYLFMNGKDAFMKKELSEKIENI